MATGDIIAVAVRPTGWDVDLTVEGWGGDQGDIAYDFALDAENEPTAATPYLDVTDTGFTSSGGTTTVIRRIYLTDVVRLPSPDEGSLDETDDGSDLVVRVSLSEWIGTTVTAVALTVPAGWATNANQGPSSAAAVLAGTNGSSLIPPSPVAQWDTYAGACPGDRAVGAELILAVEAYHLTGIAAVTMTATGRTSGHVETATVVSTTSVERARSAKSLPAYQAAIPTVGFGQGELIDCDFVAYPVAGNATTSTAGRTTITDEREGRNSLPVVCDKDDSLDLFAYVDPVGGDDGTGVVSAVAATAAAVPFATIKAALDNASLANRVRLVAGTHNFGTSLAQRNADEWRLVEAAPGVARSAVTVEVPSQVFVRNDRLMFRGVTFQGTSTGSRLHGSNVNAVRFDDCDIDDFLGKGGASSSAGLTTYRTAVTYHHDCDLGDTWPFLDARGVVIDGCLASLDFAQAWRFTANDCPDRLRLRTPNAPSADAENVIWSFNMALGLTDVNYFVLSIASSNPSNATNVALVGNAIEIASRSTGAKMLDLSGDGISSDTTHVLVWGNTLAGDKCNVFYNDSGSAVSLHTWCSVRGNSWTEYNTKSDTFGAPDGARVGNWGPLYGCGFRGNLWEESAGTGAINFPAEFTGLGTRYVGDGGLDYVLDASVAGTGNGDGDYTPDADSPLLTVFVPAPRPAFDLFGTARGPAGIGAIAVASIALPGTLERRFDHRLRRPV